MRISDWSSDVCSSDLSMVRLVGHGRNIAAPAGDFHPGFASPVRFAVAVPKPLPRLSLRAPFTHHDGIDREQQAALMQSVAKADRKSVVWGKRVCVRVYLGGRRTVKKKIQEQRR